MDNTIIFILRTALDIYATVLLVRVLMQLVQADFFNPISQTLFKLTSPVVEPLHKIFPTIGRFNTAALVAAILVKWSFYLIVLSLSGMFGAQMFTYLAVAGLELLGTLIEIYFWGIFILVISSWVGTGSHPTVRLVSQVVDPYMAIFRRFIPPIGMIDLSPMVAIFGLMIIRANVMPKLGSLVQPLLG
jgi:YggT family protein